MPEEQSGRADEILESASAVFVSDLTVAEFHVTVSRKLKLNQLDPESELVVRDAFQEHVEDDVLRRVGLSSAHYDVAGHLAKGCPVMLRTLDALHIAVARELGATLATFDRRLAEAARALRLEVVT